MLRERREPLTLTRFSIARFSLDRARLARERQEKSA
jgi:hypothetical protein